jgi:hypothetical protein
LVGAFTGVGTTLRLILVPAGEEEEGGRRDGLGDQETAQMAIQARQKGLWGGGSSISEL